MGWLVVLLIVVFLCTFIATRQSSSKYQSFFQMTKMIASLLITNKKKVVSPIEFGVGRYS